jgi:BirA family biotin operon repressor/biotin-[acetyl-CoA-carboxylase] ligase
MADRDALAPEQVAAQLTTRELGRALRHLQSIGSTSQLAYELAQQGAPHGQSVIAEEQTAGRGRRGRSWVSPPGKNLYLSLVLRPALPPERAPELTLVAAVAIAEALQSFGCPAMIKWPNDLEVGGRKIGGILTELAAEPGRIHFVVLGVGVNLNIQAHEFPDEIRGIATSVQLVTGRPVDRARFAAQVLGALESWFDRHQDAGFEVVRRRWTALSSTVGSEVRVRLESGAIEGEAEGIDASGALRVRTRSGAVQTVLAGDVETLRPAPG